MRMAFAVLKYFPFGGLERDMLRMAEAARKRGHHIVIFTSKWEGNAPSEGIEVRILPLRALSNHGRMREFARKFSDAVRLDSFDVRVAFNRIPGCDFYFAADNCYASEMPRKHSPMLLRILPRYRTFLELERKIFSPDASTRIFYIAPRQKADFISCYGTPEERFFHLPPGIDDSCVRPPDAEALREAKRRELGVASDERMLLLVASNYRLKGGDRAVEALASLPEPLRKKCKLFFAGVPDGGEGRALAEKRGVGEQVFFLGGRTDVPHLLLSADLVVHPARAEAAGTVLTEAVAVGTPLIASGVCGFRNIVEEAGCPVLPEPWDQEIFVRTIASILEHLDEYAHRALTHASTVDFRRRADTAVDLMEQFGAFSK